MAILSESNGNNGSVQRLTEQTDRLLLGMGNTINTVVCDKKGGLMEKICKDCNTVFNKTGNNQKRCESCKLINHKKSCKDRHKKKYIRKGYNQSGNKNNNWKGGIGTYIEFSKNKQCNRCKNKATLTHHKDENRYNNEESNLEALCKRCHQVHHRCWETLPKEEKLAALKRKQASTANRDELGKFKVT